MLAKAAVKAKVSNQRTLMMRCLRSRPIDETVPGPESSRGSDEPAARDMSDLLARLDRINDPAVLLGTEGQAAALYFSQFPRMLKASSPGRGFDFKSRNRRPPRDPVNALIVCLRSAPQGLFFGTVHRWVRSILRIFPRFSARQTFPGIDLMEEFRAIIADSVALTLINTSSLSPKDFLVWREACQLTEDG